MLGDAIVMAPERPSDGDPAGVHIDRLDMAPAAISTELQGTDSRDYRGEPQRPEGRVAPRPEEKIGDGMN